MFRAAICSLLTVFLSGCGALDTASTAIIWMDKAKEAFLGAVDIETAADPAYRGGQATLEDEPDMEKTLACSQRRQEALVGLGAAEHARNATFYARRAATQADKALASGRYMVARRKIDELDRGLEKIGSWLVFNDILTETALAGTPDAGDSCPLPKALAIRPAVEPRV